MLDINPEKIILFPPVAALIIFAVIYGLQRFFKHYSKHKVKDMHETDAYACGQRGVKNYVSPDYSEFYPYAVLFTLAHAIVLLVATSPTSTGILASLFIILALSMLYIVFRKVR
jgi:NADH:ubiquinone oxidoreductase subunit 3 (subunit A)